MARYWISPKGKKLKCETHELGATKIIKRKFRKEYIATRRYEIRNMPIEKHRASTRDDFLVYYKGYIKCDTDFRDYLNVGIITKAQKEALFELTGIWLDD